jgi:hypothetical protein
MVFGRALKHLLVPDAFTGASAYLMEADLAFAFGSDIQANAKGYERNLKLT